MKKLLAILKKIILLCIIFNFINLFFYDMVQAIEDGIRENPFELKEKVAVLTFDDGPSSISTSNILNILESNKVKASFFVVGKNILINKQVIDRMNSLNMDIYPHTNSHEYKYIYNKEENYFNDLNECIKYINNINKNKDIDFVRLPGGSDNKVASSNVLSRIKELLKDKPMYYIDWNVDSTDAMNNYRRKKDIINNIKTYGGKYKIEVILMHDTNVKKNTVDSLQEIINFYREKGYTFKSLSDLDDFELSYLIRNKVIYR